MSENNEQPQTPEQQPVVRILLSYNLATGETTFEGPIGNKTLCYGMLETAKIQVQQFVSEAERKQRQTVLQRVMGVTNGAKLIKPV